MATEARQVSPVQFFKDQPWGTKGQPVKKNFEARVEKATPEEAEDTDQEPVVASGDPEVEVVDAPVLNDEPDEEPETPVLEDETSDDDEDVISLGE